MLTEKEFQAQIVQVAKILGWDFIYHAQLSKWSEKGWPDLLLLRTKDARTLFVEVKNDRGKVTPRQHEVHAMLLACGHDLRVWRPMDWDEVCLTLE